MFDDARSAMRAVSKPAAALHLNNVPVRRRRFPGVPPATGLHELMTTWERGRWLPTQNECGRSTCLCGAPLEKPSFTVQAKPHTSSREEAPRLNSPPIDSYAAPKRSPVGIAPRLALKLTAAEGIVSKMEMGPIGREDCVHTRIFVLRPNRPMAHC